LRSRSKGKAPSRLKPAQKYLSVGRLDVVQETAGRDPRTRGILRQKKPLTSARGREKKAAQTTTKRGMAAELLGVRWGGEVYPEKKCCKKREGKY